jgi:hypothetical protein
MIAIGGTRYEIEYSGSVDFQEDEFRSTEYLHTHLPADLVCALVSNSYKKEHWQKQTLDALSPFQIVSKLWATSVLSHIIGDDYERSPLVFFGAWFGQLNSLLARRLANYAQRQVVLIDRDPDACEMSEYVRDTDAWLAAYKPNINVICGDALSFDLSAFADTVGATPIVVWTGVEHFDESQVKQYIDDHGEAKTVYLLQGTNMPAPDHLSLIDSCEALEQYFDGTPIYSARLKTAIGDRFQLVFAT